MDAIALRMSHVTAPAEEEVAHEVEAAKADAEKARGDREQREELDDGARPRAKPVLQEAHQLLRAADAAVGGEGTEDDGLPEHIHDEGHGASERDSPGGQARGAE